ncbi:MAG: hypothetical protein IPJ95_07370 [Gemmatimonadetes bacterium]|nr:hypothetical protein [Gemmatimonadota bacterium]MBP6669679.1 hypothetical protein [Gemmatimonadales bacterium]MBK6782225.1 hypothetical protein [Gemmatimonadota bacterium]MBK7351950.1 hypothetical protein [Gemmatimonadota bacterium]MBK7785011.1 hypothetical protein [Gemmatimonadota bacterium]
MVEGPGTLVAAVASLQEWPGGGCALGFCPTSLRRDFPPGLAFLALGLVSWWTGALVRQARRKS